MVDEAKREDAEYESLQRSHSNGGLDEYPDATASGGMSAYELANGGVLNQLAGGVTSTAKGIWDLPMCCGHKPAAVTGVLCNGMMLGPAQEPQRAMQKASDSDDESDSEAQQRLLSGHRDGDEYVVGLQDVVHGSDGSRASSDDALRPGQLPHDGTVTTVGLKKNLANKIFGYLPRCEFLKKKLTNPPKSYRILIFLAQNHSKKKILPKIFSF